MLHVLLRCRMLCAAYSLCVCAYVCVSSLGIRHQSRLFECLFKWEFRLKALLTGTPVQNQLSELFSLLHFLEPKKFPDVEAFLMENSDLTKGETVRVHAGICACTCTYTHVHMCS